MSDDLVPLATYETSFEAHAARGRLEAAGIAVQVSDENVAGVLSHVGTAIGGVKLLVWKSDFERAEAVLFSDERLEDEPRRRDRQRWKCPGCNEWNEPSFDSCWSCGGDYQKTPPGEQDESAAQPNLAADAVTEPGESAYVSPDPDLDATMTRAWRASIIGLVVCPVFLHFYSLWLLLDAAVTTKPFHAQATRWFYAALTVDLAALAVYGACWWLVNYL